jgi:hypothetical protein
MGNGDGKVFSPVLNEMMAWGFRAMLTASVAVGGWALARIVTTGDDISSSVHKHDTKLEILDERGKEINDRLVGFNGELNDHENRIRQLERNKDGRDGRPPGGH